MVVDFIHQGRNEVLLPLRMNGGSLMMKKLTDSLENLVLRKCLQIAVTITLMTLTLWKSSLHILQLCLLRRHSYIHLEHFLTTSLLFTYFTYIDKRSIKKLNL